ncbi:unnamed protein product [Blepharisma stoltei]|uniref:Bromodomain containing protein n=1 Tax=Blepharisma stoltei TaxID=1481888 RepID=A0AAU9IHV1_9CILI|nr:unnamed protein product [Blepharisma stoltei]
MVDKGKTKSSLNQSSISLGLDLMRYLEALPESYPFLEPVDYVGLQLTNYPLIIKQPMDLSTARRKLITGKYSSLEDYISDLNLIWANCKTYNLEGSDIYVMAQKMESSMHHYYKKLLNKQQEHSQSNTVSFAEKVEFAERVRKVAPSVLKEIVEIVQKQCSNAYSEPREDKLQIKVDLLDKNTFTRISELAENYIASRPKKIRKVSKA